MGCGSSKNGVQRTSPPTASSSPQESGKQAPDLLGSERAAASEKPTAQPVAGGPPAAPAKPSGSVPSAAKADAPDSAAAAKGKKEGGARFAEPEPEPEDRRLKQQVSFQKDEKPDSTKERKIPDTPFVKKGVGFDAMFEEDEKDPDEPSPAPKGRKAKKGGVNFDSGAKSSDEKNKAQAPGTPYVRLGAAFDDLYEDEDEDEGEDAKAPEPAPPKKSKSKEGSKDKGKDSKKKEKKKKGGVNFSSEAGDEDQTKEKMAPGTPFVKLGAAFDDLYEEDDDGDDGEDEPPPEPPKKEEKKKSKKHRSDKKAKFAEETEDKPAKTKQPGTPFVKLGGFNDLYDEDEEDEEEQEELEPPPKKEKPKKGGNGGGGVKFASGTQDKNREDADHVPGTPFVKLGGFNDLYDEDEYEYDDDDEDKGAEKGSRSSTGKGISKDDQSEDGDDDKDPASKSGMDMSLPPSQKCGSFDSALLEASEKICCTPDASVVQSASSAWVCGSAPNSDLAGTQQP
eukprot:CAMPEP_0177608044 /NCGR_PEP_ID=MMETSP0419_2-20121207/18251_1 /TAXON_ID=582737 /ORGANISM="Tetraselmis sp., Strain GSL018" /LENGTH=507 /DNA_ID=CAMNT_0019102687 /DNA_START=449 /DNA_END=1976 /DNA_ORIENTATION=+